MTKQKSPTWRTDWRVAVKGPERFEVLKKRDAFNRQIWKAAHDTAWRSKRVNDLLTSKKRKLKERTLTKSIRLATGYSARHIWTQKHAEIISKPFSKELIDRLLDDVYSTRQELESFIDEQRELADKLHELRTMTHDRRLFDGVRYPPGDVEKEEKQDSHKNTRAMRQLQIQIR